MKSGHRSPWPVKALLATALAGACSPASSAPAPRASASDSALSPWRLATKVDLEDGVGTFTSSEEGFSTNSFWIEGPTGLVVIDTQFLVSEASALLRELPARTHKPIVLAVVLHPNPDKFNGADLFRAKGIPVVSSAEVISHVPEVAAQRRRAFSGPYGADYPAETPHLEPIAFDGAVTTLRAGGVEFQVERLGRGCSEAHLVAAYRGHVFTGDLVISQTHAWLELGYVKEGLAALAAVQATGPRRVHPGRGPSGGPELLAASSGYLGTLLEDVKELGDRPTSEERAVEELRARLTRRYPNYAFPVFLHGLGAVWRRRTGDYLPARVP